MRPISLSNIVKKIFSRIIYERHKDLFPNFVSEKQAGFVQGRSIVDNILVIYEIFSEMRKRGKPPNMVMKLDMMKVYDRDEWLFLTKVLRKICFYEEVIDMIFRLLSNNWYSILLNG